MIDWSDTTTTKLSGGVIAVRAQVDGKGRVVITRPLPLTATDEMKSAFRQRMIANLECRCPQCDAVLDVGGLKRDERAAAGAMAHEPGCPVSDQAFEAMAERWKKGIR